MSLATGVLWPGGAPPNPAFCGEEAREQVIAAYGLDHNVDDTELARCVRFAANLCAVPIALVSLVEGDRQRFLGRQGIDAETTPRSTSFCALAMLTGDVTEVPDATLDPRFAQFDLVTGPPHIRFYAGAPLISTEGAPLGTLCVIDSEPRPGGLTAIQREGLELMARTIMQRLEYRRADIESQIESAESARRFAMLADNIPDMAWSCTIEGAFDFYNARWDEFTGVPGPIDAEGWRPLVHADDTDEVFRDWYGAFGAGEAFSSEYRMRHASGDWRWVLSRAMPMRNDTGTIVRWFGTVTDVDAAHRLSEQRDLLARELSHRIKNIFAVIAGLVALRARKVPEAVGFAEDLAETIRALGRANDYVRPLDGRTGNRLFGLLEELMAPYRTANDTQITVEGEDCPIGLRSATPLALVFHELATNSAKYGALSSDDGSIQLTVSLDRMAGQAVVAWRERGGPAPVPGADEGFGSRLVRMSVEGQLEGSIERRWTGDGVDIDIAIPLRSLAN
jgi:PAS domain S-box-containing protein